MAYDEELAARVRGLLASDEVAEKRMFGGLAFLLGGHMSVAASGQGGLLVRVDPAEAEALLAEPGVEEADMGRGPMRGWLRVHTEVLDDEVLRRWVGRATAYARGLPPKEEGGRSRRGAGASPTR
jgi:TfoX/Sxy family transcriptional regulator of competence genes